MADHIYKGTVTGAVGDDSFKTLRALALKYKCSLTVETERVTASTKKLHYVFEGTFDQIKNIRLHFDAIPVLEDIVDDDAPYQVYPFKGWGPTSYMVFKEDSSNS